MKIEASGDAFIPQRRAPVRSARRFAWAFKSGGEPDEIRPGAEALEPGHFEMPPHSKARPPTPTRQSVRPSAQTLASRVEELERSLERVRAAYEAYFLGIERRAPELARQQLQHKLHELQSVPMVNTAVRFRFQNLVQRFTQLAGHWSRTMREIETGTYRRDVQKAARHMAERDRPAGE